MHLVPSWVFGRKYLSRTLCIHVRHMPRYFRHYLNLVILWSVWNEYDLIPYVHSSFTNAPSDYLHDISETSKRWVWSEGTYLVWWMKYQVFAPLLLLQFLNIFWFALMLRILYRYS